MVSIFYTILFLWNNTDLVLIFQVSASSGTSSTNVPNPLIEIPSNQNYSGCYVSKRQEERVFTISTLPTIEFFQDSVSHEFCSCI